MFTPYFFPAGFFAFEKNSISKVAMLNFGGYKGSKKNVKFNFGYLGCLQVFENHNPGYVLFFSMIVPNYIQIFLWFKLSVWNPVNQSYVFKWDF